MGETSKDVLALLTQLMPGFLTAWVVYGLTTYTKPPQFERVVQALIYSFLVNAIVALLEICLLAAGNVFRIGMWDHTSQIIASSLIALLLGLVLSYYMRNDDFYFWARNRGITNRTAYPTEWYGAFAARPARYLVLHLAGGRRLMGYPSEWPTEPTAGHFRLTDAAWLDDDNNEIRLDADESILIEAKQVEMVEILKGEQDKPNAPEAPQSETVHPVATVAPANER